MNFTIFLLVSCSVGIALSAKVASIDFNDGETEKETSEDNTENDVSPESGRGGVSATAAAAAAAAAAQGNKELLKKAMSAAMKRPGAYNRLQQVLPIVRSMSPAQRLAMASLVMSQLTAAPEEPLPPLDGQPKNVTENLMLPISLDIATMFRGLGRPNAVPRSAFSPQLFPGMKRSRPDRQSSTSSGINRRNVHVYSGEKSVQAKPARSPVEASLKDCQYITNSICSTAEDYPEDEILSYLKKSRATELTALLADSINIPAGFTPTSTDQLNVMERRLSDEGSESKGSMCSSRVELARPKRARATSGLWKYIVNTGEYTQTLRLEICSKPGGSCTYLPEEVDSECVQVYNYHRLLTFDESTGLTMDIFKVPTCCSCRVRGYGGQMLSPKVEHTNSISDESRPPVKVIRGTLQRRPAVKTRAPPPLPLEPDGVRPATKYPPYDNPLRRFTRNNSTYIMERGGYHQRHPTLPAESLEAASSMPDRNQYSGQIPGRPKRVNYSYHPILEFFRPGRTAQSLERRQAAPPEWTPISEPSAAVLASPSYRQSVIGQNARH